MAQPSAPISINRTLMFAPVGVATSETIQVNLANTALSGSTVAASCSGTISFSVAGVKNQPAAVKFTVMAGQIFSTSLAWGSLGVGGRAEVVAAVEMTQTLTTPCALSTSLETYDTGTGATHSYQTNPTGNFPFTVPVIVGH